MNDKQKHKLQGMLTGQEPIVYIGKDGVTDAIRKEADEALELHEIIRCGVTADCIYDPIQAGAMLCAKTLATPVGYIDYTLAIYRESKTNKKIVL